jgi:Fe-S oxidoreductase
VFAGRVAFHRSCHCRGTTSGAATEQLLRSIAGLELVPFGEAEQCCGFGGDALRAGGLLPDAPSSPEGAA